MSVQSTKQLRKDITPRRWIVVNFGFQYVRGNRRPYFSITGTVCDKDTGDRRDGYTESCGCIHDQVAAHFPELAHLIRWHLVDDDGTPMHYEANAAYWLEFHHGISAWTGHEGRMPLDSFKSHVVWREGVDTFGDLLDPIPTDHPPGSGLAKSQQCKRLRARVDAWCAARDLSADMKTDMKAAGIEYMTPEQIAAA